jgi:hypothetical protein
MVKIGKIGDILLGHGPHNELTPQCLWSISQRQLRVIKYRFRHDAPVSENTIEI